MITTLKQDSVNTTGLAGSQRGYLLVHITMSSEPLINDFYFLHAALWRTANVSGIFTAWRSGIMINFSEVSYTEPSLAAFATKRIDHALLHMIPLLLCASHIAKSLLFFSTARGPRGFDFTSKGTLDAAFTGEESFAEQASTMIKHEGGWKTPGPLAYVEATALGEADDNST